MKIWEKLTEAEKFKMVFAEKVKRQGAAELMEALDWQGFFIAPASAGHHGNYAGGLVAHSNNVYRRLVILAAEEDRRAGWKRAKYSGETLAIVALLHDVCKTQAYRTEEKEGRRKYTYNTESMALGHGEKSVYMIMQHMKLTEEEALALRWHMGAFDAAARSDLRDFSRAVQQSDLVLLLHMADMLASNIDER